MKQLEMLYEGKAKQVFRTEDPDKIFNHYKDAAIEMLTSLSSDNYQSGKSNPAFLLHSTGHWPAHSEIDASIIYADYYYIEALLRLIRLQKGEGVLGQK